MKKMMYKKNGSALLMIVGLLTILALLGSTFLLIARHNAKETELLSTRDQSEQIATGWIKNISQALKDDLYIDATNNYPYGNAGTDFEKYIDCPTSVTTATSDTWLASLDNSIKSNIIGTSAIFSKIDGGSTDNAYLVDTRITDKKGNKYYAGARVVDLSGLICVNTAGKLPADPNVPSTVLGTTLVGIYPPLVDMSTAIGSTIYDTLNVGRYGNPTDTPDFADLGTYYTACASRLFNPNNPSTTNCYKPFSIGDEMYLRWLGSGMTIGRIYTLAGTIAPATRRLFTTYNCSRSLLPHPFTDTSGTSYTTKLQMPYDLPLDTDAERKALYQYVLNILGSGNELKAAHIIANLWAYTSSDADIAANLFEFSGFDTSGMSVYGFVPQPVFSEAYFVCISKDSGTDADGDGTNECDTNTVYAIEIMNPFPMEINIEHFVVSKGGVDVSLQSLAGKNTLSSYDRIIICCIENSNPAVTVTAADFNITGGTGVTLADNAIIKFDTSEIQLKRTTTGGNLIVDKFSKPTSWDITAPAMDTAKSYNIRRDDGNVSAKSYRCIVGRGVEPATPQPVVTAASNLANIQNNHKLGNANEVTVIVSAPTNKSMPYTWNSNETTRQRFWNSTTLTGIVQTGIERDSSGTFTTVPQILNSSMASDTEDKVGKYWTIDFSDTTLVNTTNTNYPAIPWPLLLDQVTERLTCDSVRPVILSGTSKDVRIYGKININTAPLDVLKRLPFQYIDANGNGQQDTGEALSDAIKTEIANVLIAYRNNGSYTLSSTFGSAAFQRSEVGITRTTNGFISPGEAALPLRYIVAKGITLATTDPAYQTAVNSLYSQVANLITVNSDTYAAYIEVQKRDTAGNPLNPAKSWKYLAVFDRSNCTTVNDNPAILLFTSIK